MKPWFGLSVLTAVFFGLYNVCVRLAAGRIGDAQGSAVLEGSAFVGLLLIVLFHRGSPAIETTPAGLTYSILGGACIAVGTVVYFAAFRLQPDMTLVGPVVWLGCFIVMAILGFTVFKEPLTLKRSAGILLSLAGIYLLQSTN